MAGKPAEPRRRERPPAGGRGDTGERPERRERIGPLVLERLLKADGRALILYRAERDRR